MNARRAAIPIGRLASLALLLALAFVLGCATNPVTGHHELSLVNESQEIAMGKEGNTAVLAEYGTYSDPALQAYVDSMGHALAKVSHRPDLQWTFTLLDDPTVNAFALPGGYIYITRGIMAYLGSEAQLAGVLGHEIGHVTARHSARQMTQQQLAGIGLAVGSVVSRTVARYGQLAQQGLGLMFLKYGRDDETQADQLGVQYSTAAGWDSREMPGTYRMLGRVSAAGGQRLPSFLSTHPDPGDREQRTTALSKEATAGKTGLQIRQRGYVSRLDGVVFGRDPRNGYFEGARYYHPRMKFTIDLPAEWKYQDSNAMLAATEPNQQAQLAVSAGKPAGASPEEMVRQLESQGKITGAEGQSETIGGWPAWVGHVQAPAQDGSTHVITLGLVRMDAEHQFQFIGQSAAPNDANDQKMLAAIRSARPLADASRLNPQPARVKVVRATSASTLSAFLEKHKPLGAPPDQIAIMNDMELEETVAAGTLVKVVTAARLH